MGRFASVMWAHLKGSEFSESLLAHAPVGGHSCGGRMNKFLALVLVFLLTACSGTAVTQSPTSAGSVSASAPSGPCLKLSDGWLS